MLSLLPQFVKYGSWKDYQNLYKMCKEKLDSELDYEEDLLVELDL